MEQPTPALDAGTGAELTDLVDGAVALARRWAQASATGQTESERATSAQLGALVRDDAGLDLAVRFVDRVARPEDSRVAARDLSRLSVRQAAGFLRPLDRIMLGMGSLVAPMAPALVVPAARIRLRQIIGHLVVDAEDPALGAHLAAARADGFRLNVNLLGEAVLGEQEATARTARTLDLLRRPDVDYVSIKVSSLVSQINPWDTEGTVQRCLDRLRPLYQAARARSPHAFVNLDMEEYRDLDLTMELFIRLLSEPEFADLEAGIVLQAYLPDALPALERLIDFARQRRQAGRAPVKVRLVKGANLAMEQVEAALHGWTAAPYPSKVQTDANYLRCIERALRLDAAGEAGLRLGVASHNLFDLALAHLLAQAREVTAALDVEMLQGMAPAQARAVRADTGSVLLYTPVVASGDFDVAVAYLIRRLEENAAPENFLHAFFAAEQDLGTGTDGSEGYLPGTGPDPLADQEQRFRDSLAAIPDTPVGPRRSPDRPEIGDTFANTPDSDPALPEIRAWAADALSTPPLEPSSRVLTSAADVADVVHRGLAAGPEWAGRPAAERAAILRQGARNLEARRGALLSVMAAEGGKTVAEADPEISEAVDFARYYADRALELEPGAHPNTDGARFEPSPLTVVTPPWNFPVAIPIGGVLAALAAGSPVIVKPAHPTPGCVEVAVQALHDAGVPTEALQVVRVADREVGRALVAHPEVDTVVLTGSTETARMFSSWRSSHAGGPGLLGETSGKNALVVTPAADLDLAVADLVRSAFGHAGQKCSAASLAILVGSVGSSARFRRQLLDAVSSLRVGWPSELASVMGPVITPPDGKLLRALTTLEPGEEWLVQPRQLDDSGRLWSPGLKEGVTPGSFFHLTEVFGPVLGIMRAATLKEAIALQNATAFGLTGGLHSLDEREIDYWLERVEVGNAYVNRHITGAIVQRQPFGGWKASVVGPGAKAGGPNYVAQFGRWVTHELPVRIADLTAPVRALLRELVPLVGDRSERIWLRSAAGSDAHVWDAELGRTVDASGLAVESNVLRYRPLPVVWVRTEPGARVVEVIRLLVAGALTGTEVRVSLDADTSAHLKSLDGRDPETTAALRALARYVDRAEHAEDFCYRVERGEVAGRTRLVGSAPGLLSALAQEDLVVLAGPVLATGRRELLGMLREQAISRTRHRFGHLPAQ